jgi:hypothetical protein
LDVLFFSFLLLGRSLEGRCRDSGRLAMKDVYGTHRASREEVRSLLSGGLFACDAFVGKEVVARRKSVLLAQGSRFVFVFALSNPFSELELAMDETGLGSTVSPYPIITFLYSLFLLSSEANSNSVFS